VTLLKEIGALCAKLDIAQWAVLKSCDVPLDYLRSAYSRWLDAGNGGALKYIDDRLDIICDPFGHRPWAKSAMVIAFRPKLIDDSPLRQLPPPQPGGPVATIAEYALNEDYHITGQRLLKSIADALGEHQCECCVDSSPVPEKELLRLAGIGAIDTPNSLARVNGCGCRAHIGVLFTSLELPSLIRDEAPKCGDCHSCLAICPNHAMSGEGTIRVRQCRSWLASEWHGPLSREQQLMLHKTLFGCSLCSCCCPDDRHGCHDLRIDPFAIMEMPTAALKRLTATTPISHVSPSILKRNAAAAILTQCPDSERNALVERLLPMSAGPAVRETIAAWN